MKHHTLLLFLALVAVSWVNVPETAAQTSPMENDVPGEGAPSEDETTGDGDTEETPIPGLAEQIAALASPDPAVRYRAVVALGQLRMGSVVPHLSRVLRSDPSPDIRGWALRSLAEIDTAEAREAIVEAAESDADVRLRQMALEVCRACAPSPFETPMTVRRPSAVQQTADTEHAPSPTLTSRIAEERRRGNTTLAIGVVVALTSIIPIGTAAAFRDQWEECGWSTGSHGCYRTDLFAASMALFALGGLQLCLSVIPIVLGARRVRRARVDADQTSTSALSALTSLSPLFATTGRGGVVLGLTGAFF